MVSPRKAEAHQRIEKLLKEGGEPLTSWIDSLKEALGNTSSNFNHSILELHPADIAIVFSYLDKEESQRLFSHLPLDTRGEVLVELDEIYKSWILNDLSIHEISPIVENLETDDITSIISDVSEEKQKEILNSLDSEDSFHLRDQLNFREDTAGRMMSQTFVSVEIDTSVRKSIMHLRKMNTESDDIYLVFVTDHDGVLKGYVKLKDIFFAPLNQKISKIMDSRIHFVHYDTDREEIVQIFKKYDLVSLGVVDDSQRLIGRITVDDILDVLDEEAGEDILRLGGVSDDENLKSSFWQSFKGRILWLNVNLITATVASLVVSRFESTISQLVVLATLMPIVAGLGGNAGTQSITVMVRNLATGEVGYGKYWEAILKELRIGVMNGLFLGILTGLVIFLIQGNPKLSIIFGFSLFVNLTLASISGGIIPVILKRMGVDPAVASSIFVTAITDIFGFFFFLGMASLYLVYFP
jgi:magnesium transporter